MSFENSNLTTDRFPGDTELFRGPGEAQVTHRRLESYESIDRGGDGSATFA